jgi:hypothetical protein
MLEITISFMVMAGALSVEEFVRMSNFSWDRAGVCQTDLRRME